MKKNWGKFTNAWVICLKIGNKELVECLNMYGYEIEEY